MLAAISYQAFTIPPFKNFEISHCYWFRHRQAQQKKSSSSSYAELLQSDSNAATSAPHHLTDASTDTFPAQQWKCSMALKTITATLEARASNSAGSGKGPPSQQPSLSELDRMHTSTSAEFNNTFKRVPYIFLRENLSLLDHFKERKETERKPWYKTVAKCTLIAVIASIAPSESLALYF